MGEEDYLQHAIPMISSHLKNTDTQASPVVFVPYAGVTMSHDEYTDKVKAALHGLNIKGIHEFADPQAAVSDASAIMVGGGNTFRLLHQLYRYDLIDRIKERVGQGMPYIGWSAGSNICGMSIRTTNDMPIIEPPSFDSLGFLPCQLNPHYTDYQPPNHNGESRDQRLAEFTTLNPTMPVLAIREGTALLKKGNELTLIGELAGFVFIGNQKNAISEGENLNKYLG